MLPAKMKNFSQTRAGEQQQSQGRDPFPEASVALETPKRFSKARQLLFTQEPLSTAFRESFDPARWVTSFRRQSHARGATKTPDSDDVVCCRYWSPR